MKIEHTSNLPGLIIEKIYRYGDGGLDFDVVDAMSTINAIDVINMNDVKSFFLYVIKDKKNLEWKALNIAFERQEEKDEGYYVCKFSFEI